MAESMVGGAVDEQVKQANDYYTQIAQMYGGFIS